MTNKVTVTGAVVGKNNITLFLRGAEPFMTLPQENWRTKDIMEKVSRIAITMEPIEIDLDEFTLANVLQEAVGDKLKVSVDHNTGELQIKSGNTTLPAKALEMHVERAAVDGGKGLKNFMAKFEVIKRPYTKTELLKFLQNADLPFMDDGSILGFKILAQAENDYMVDHHSRRVRQRLGSLVFMPESKVDQSRALCSTGLHIASRKYLSGFWHGNSRLCLVKIHPKDVVSVPEGEETKMRVSAYHIVKVFSAEDGGAIAHGSKDIHELPGALQMLEEAVAGNIGPIIETIECRGYGEISVTLLDVKHTRIERKKKRVTVSQRGKVKLVSPAQINAMKKLAKIGKRVSTWTPAYIKKMAQAQVYFDKGKSLRWISEKLGIDRDSMTANLDRRDKRKKVA